MDEQTLRQLLLAEADQVGPVDSLPEQLRRAVVRRRVVRLVVVAGSTLIPLAAAATVIGLVAATPAHKATLNIEPAQSPSAGVVPWVDRPAQPYAPVTPSPASAPKSPPNTPACTAGQLHVVNVYGSGLTQSDGYLIALRNVGSRSCLLRGYPTSLTGVRSDGRVIDLHPHKASKHLDIGVPPLDVSSVQLRPRRDLAYLEVFSERACLNGSGSTDGVPHYLSASVGLGSHGTLRWVFPHEVTTYMGCGVGLSPFQPPPLPQPSTAGTDEALSVLIRAPASVRPGQLLKYTVTLTNDSSQDVPLTSCPSYQESFEADTGQFIGKYQLNCDTVHAIPSHGHVIYAMQLPVPVDASGTVKFFWAFLQEAIVGSGAPIQITS